MHQHQSSTSVCPRCGEPSKTRLPVAVHRMLVYKTSYLSQTGLRRGVQPSLPGQTPNLEMAESGWFVFTAVMLRTLYRLVGFRKSDIVIQHFLSETEVGTPASYSISHSKRKKKLKYTRLLADERLSISQGDETHNQYEARPFLAIKPPTHAVDTQRKKHIAQLF